MSVDLYRVTVTFVGDNGYLTTSFIIELPTGITDYDYAGKRHVRDWLTMVMDPDIDIVQISVTPY